MRFLGFFLQDYKCTVEYYVTHFLVHESKARIRQRRVQTLRIDAIDHGSSRWRGADILIFNTAHWWSHSKTKAGLVPFWGGFNFLIYRVSIFSTTLAIAGNSESLIWVH